MVQYILQCADSVGWVTGLVSGLYKVLPQQLPQVHFGDRSSLDNWAIKQNPSVFVYVCKLWYNWHIVQVRRGAGVMATVRRVGRELSRRLYVLMTSTDAQLILR